MLLLFRTCINVRMKKNEITLRFELWTAIYFGAKRGQVRILSACHSKVVYLEKTKTHLKGHIIAGFRSRPVLRRLRLREFISRSRLRLLRSENNFFLHVNELSKITWNTCTSMYIDPILFYFYSRKDIMLKLKLEPEPGQSYGSGSCSSQIPRLRAAPAPKPCMII